MLKLFFWGKGKHECTGNNVMNNDDYSGDAEETIIILMVEMMPVTSVIIMMVLMSPQGEGRYHEDIFSTRLS